MDRRNLIIMMLAAASALAQTSTHKVPAGITSHTARKSTIAGQKSLGEAAISSNDPVMIIHGICDGDAESTPALNAGTCTTKITKQQFEGLLETLKPSMGSVPPILYTNVATGYADMLGYAHAGLMAGVEKDPRFEDVLRVTRLRTLGDTYRGLVNDQAHQDSAAQVEAYYKKNIASYEEVKVRRLFLPRNNKENLNDVDFRAKATKLAGEIRERAAKGADMDDLQKEAWQALGIKNLRATDAALVRRGSLSAKAEEEVFALQPGQVSTVFEIPAAYIIYKWEGRKILSLDEVKEEIQTKLYREKLDDSHKTLSESVHVDYNEAYFGKSPASIAEAGLAPTDVVMTIHGLCDSSELNSEGSKAGSCTTEVTLKELETIRSVVKATTQKVVSTLPRSVAEGYLDMLVYGNAAKKAGVEKDPRFEQVLPILYKRALSDMYRLKRDEEARQVSAGEIEAYYKKNAASFEQVHLRHFAIPKDNPNQSQGLDYSEKATRLATEFRERAIKGEDMEKLQQEANQAMGLKGSSDTSMQPVRKGTLEEKAEREIFALQPGQVSGVMENPSAYVFYKLESRGTISLEEAQAEITRLFYSQKLEKLTKALAESVSVAYNQKYFASVLPAELAVADNQSK